jgi:hypothetical protein
MHRLVIALLAACEAPVASEPARVPTIVEGLFAYDHTYLLDREHFGHTYTDASGHMLIVPSSAPAPTELERMARIVYLPKHAAPLRYLPASGGQPTSIAPDGDVVAFAPVPIEEATLHLVASFTPACVDAFVTAEIYESDDASVRLVARSRPAGGRMRFRRVPPHVEKLVVAACASDATQDVVVTAIAP